MGSRKSQAQGIVWKGGPVECYNSGLKKADCLFYKSFFLNDTIYFVGDFALCKYKSGSRICRLMTLFHSNQPWHANDREKAVVRWYTWARDLESKHNPQRIKFDLQNEVVEDYRGVDVIISLENIVRKCRVVFATEEDAIDLIRREKLNTDLYFSCRYKICFDVIEPIFSSDAEWDKNEVFRTLTTHNSCINNTSNLKSPLKRKISNEENKSASKSPRLAATMDLLSITTPDQKRSVRRNLNNSFTEILSSEHETSPLNYSIVSPNSPSKNTVKIKLRVSQKQNPQVILEPLKDDTVEKYLNSKTKTTNDISSPSKLRRSSRSIQRKSYAELISPEKFIPNEFNAETTYTQTPSIRAKRNISPSPEKHKTETTRMSSVGKRTISTPVRYISNATTPRKSILKSTVDCTTPSKRVTISDENFAETPKKSIVVSSPRSVMKSTPSKRLKQIKEGIVTPSIQKREQRVDKVDTPLIQARSQLHVSHIPEALPCREKEYSDIFGFLEGKLEDGCGGCMYISGVPGTGKTATVTAVIKKLQEMAQDGDITEFDYVNLNGMRLTEPRQAYVEILKQLTGKTILWEQAQSMLDSRFSKNKKSSKPVIMLVDELDVLCTKRQDVVYNLLDWPTKANAQLIVVTIANTMDLPERLLMGRVTSRLGLTRLTFQPYSFRQLQEIVLKRLEGLNTFNPDAVQLVARKVASVSGDARRALDICRRAAEVAEMEGDYTLVSMTHVNNAINAMITQPKVQAIKHCSRLEQLTLQAVVAEVERTGVEETTFMYVYTMLSSLSTLDGFNTVSQTRALEAVNKLGACRLLLTDQKCSDIHQRIILNVSADDVFYALKKD